MGVTVTAAWASGPAKPVIEAEMPDCYSYIGGSGITLYTNASASDGGIHAGKVLTYAAIIRTVWGYSDYGSVKKLQVNMKNIRKKMGVTPGEKRYIINELGVGYRMLEDDK